MTSARATDTVGGMTDERQDVEEHLRAASDAILLLVREVDELERHKRGVQPDDPRFRELAADVRRAARDLAEFTEQEEAWARGASAAGDSTQTISESTSSASLSEILARWREVERRLHEARPGSPEAAALFAEFGRIRDEYMKAFQAKGDS